MVDKFDFIIVEKKLIDRAVLKTLKEHGSLYGHFYICINTKKQEIMDAILKEHGEEAAANFESLHKYSFSLYWPILSRKGSCGETDESLDNRHNL